MNNSPIRVLHVDSDPSLLDLTSESLERENERFDINLATSVEEGLDQIRNRPPDCVVSDYDMPGTNGIEFFQAIRETHPDLPFILFTGKGSESVSSDAMTVDVTDYLQKGTGREQYELLANRITSAVQTRRATQEAARQKELMRLTEIAGDTGGWELDLETEELQLTEGARRLTGLSPEDSLTLEEAFDLYHPDDRSEIRAAVDKTAQTGTQTTGTWRLQPQDSEQQRLVNVTLTPVASNGDVATLRGAINDVTEIREREREVESERRFIEQSLNALDDLFYVLNPDGTIRWWNDQVTDITGYTESELSGTHATEIFPEDEQEKITDGLVQAFSSDYGTAEADLQTVDGDQIPHKWTGTRLTDPDGETTGIVGIAQDISERRQRERRFRALVEESSDIISIVDADGRFQYQSPSVERILGYVPEETVGDTAWEYIHPDDRNRVREIFNKWRTNSGAKESVEYRTRHTDDSWRWVEARGTEQFDNPAVNGYIINSRDITTQKELEGRLSLYRDIIERLDDPVMIQTIDGEFRLANDALCSFAGLSKKELLNNDEYVFMDPETATTIARQKQRVIESEEPVEYTIKPTFEYSDREAIFYTARYPYYEDGELAGTLAIWRNVTNLEERTRQLNVLDNILRHNIRNDMNVIYGRAGQLRAELGDELSDAADTILDRADSLLTTSEKSREVIAVLNEPREPTPIDLAQMARGVADEAANDWPDADIDVTGPSQLVVSATGSIQTALEELFTNAVIHNDEEEPCVRVKLAIDESWGTLSVRDNGPGIPEFDRDVLESGEAIKTLSHGSGLGLWKVYWSIKHSEGQICVDDREPRGTEITIGLPLATDR